MNFQDLTEEQFNRMAEQLCAAWATLEWLRTQTDAVQATGRPSPTGTIAHRKRMISEALEQDPDKKPHWPPVRKWQVGLTQYRTMEYCATVEVEAANRDEAKKKAFEVARKDAERFGPLIDWTEQGESRSAWERHDHERDLDDDVWCCDEIND